MSRDSQSRKWQLTIEEPFSKEYEESEEGKERKYYTREIIRERALSLKSLIYFCAAEEVGGKTDKHHIHLYMAFGSGVRFSTIKNLFPGAHIENARGTSSENRDYIDKSGKWENAEKNNTKIPGTFEEWGECPVDRRGGRSDLADIVDMIQDGATNAEIREEYTGLYFLHQSKIERIRQELQQESAAGEFRRMNVTYMFGSSGTGKTRFINDTYGAKAYRVTDYTHPFDSYRGESVIAFDEYASQIKMTEMNNYLDGYRIDLPSRYSNKTALYTTVYIISNLDLLEQYQFDRLNRPEIWETFSRRIHKVIRFMPDGTRREYETREYLTLSGKWTELPDDEPTPWDEPPPVEYEEIPISDKEPNHE